MAENLTMWTRGTDGYRKYLQDVSNLVLSSNENGFYIATWTMLREFGVAWEDLGLNSQMTVYGPRCFDTAWDGRLETIEPAIQNGKDMIQCSAVGYWASASDLFYNGVLGSGVTPESMLTTLNAAYLPQLSYPPTLVTTGRTGDGYQTPNTGTDDVVVSDVVKKVCAIGDSSNNRIVPAVWENRNLSTSAVTTVNPSPDYVLRRKDINSTGLRVALSNVQDRVTIRYIDNGTGLLARVTVNDTTVQGNFSVDYQGAGIPGTNTNYIRTKLLDFTGLGPISATAATNRANVQLNDSKRTKADSKAIVVSADWSIVDRSRYQEIPLWSIRAGKWLQIPDLFPRPNVGGSGASSGDSSVTTMFYITQTSYDAESGVLTITPDNSSALENLV